VKWREREKKGKAGRKGSEQCRIIVGVLLVRGFVESVDCKCF